MRGKAKSDIKIGYLTISDRKEMVRIIIAYVM